MLRAAVPIASLLAADVTAAAAQSPTRIRGTIESIGEQAKNGALTQTLVGAAPKKVIVERLTALRD